MSFARSGYTCCADSNTEAVYRTCAACDRRFGYRDPNGTVQTKFGLQESTAPALSLPQDSRYSPGGRQRKCPRKAECLGFRAHG